MDVGHEHQPQGNVPDMPMCVGFKCVLVLFVAAQPFRITEKKRVSRNTGTSIRQRVYLCSGRKIQWCIPAGRGFLSKKWCQINMIQNDLLVGGFKYLLFSPLPVKK